jgi:hypothetical protein
MICCGHRQQAAETPTLHGSTFPEHLDFSCFLVPNTNEAIITTLTVTLAEASVPTVRCYDARRTRMVGSSPFTWPPSIIPRETGRFDHYRIQSEECSLGSCIGDDGKKRYSDNQWDHYGTHQRPPGRPPLSHVIDHLQSPLAAGRRTFLQTNNDMGGIGWRSRLP